MLLPLLLLTQKFKSCVNCLHKCFLAQTQFWCKHGFGTNTGFGMNIVCELFPPIHTEGFHCAGQGHVIFAMNSRAVCQPNVM